MLEGKSMLLVEWWSLYGYSLLRNSFWTDLTISTASPYCGRNSVSGVAEGVSAMWVVWRRKVWWGVCGETVQWKESEVESSQVWRQWSDKGGGYEGLRRGEFVVSVRDRRRGTVIPPFLFISVFFLVEKGERDVRGVCIQWELWVSAFNERGNV